MGHQEELPAEEFKGPHHTAADLLPAPLRRILPILGICIASLAVVGFLVGVREPASPIRRPAKSADPAGVNLGIPPAVAFWELATGKIQRAPDRLDSLSSLKFDQPGPFDSVIRTNEMKLATLADRAKNRAFDGAPQVFLTPLNNSPRPTVWLATAMESKLAIESLRRFVIHTIRIAPNVMLSRRLPIP